MEIVYMPRAVEDIAYFKKIGNKAIQKKIEALLKEIRETPYTGTGTGTGKVEALKYELSGYWSHRINGEHRIVYKVIDKQNVVEIYSLKGHY